MDTFDATPISKISADNTIECRAAGVLLGLAAGDKNGGPQRLAILLSYSMFVNGQFDVDDIWDRYSKWYETGGFDTGATFMSVIKELKYDQKLKPKDVSRALYEDAINNKRTPSVGIGSAHRAAMLSAFPFLKTPFDGKAISDSGPFDDNNNENENESELIQVDDENHDEKQLNEQIGDNDSCDSLKTAAIEESCLSHYAPLSRNCSVLVNYLCRSLIVGNSWKESLRICHQLIDDEILQNILMLFINDKEPINDQKFRRTLSKGGYAPEVLKAALYFLNAFSSFDSSINAAIRFAGPSNYCPVLVGSIGGARYGMDVVTASKHWKHKWNLRAASNDAIATGLDSKEIEGLRIYEYEQKLAVQIGALWK